MNMFWDKKKKPEDGGLPELPPMKVNISPKIAPPPENTEDRNRLPSFPDSASHREFSQAAIKEAIREPIAPPKPREFEEWKPSAEPIRKLSRPEIPMPQKEERKEIYVKLDKFKSAKKTMALLASNVEEMEELIRKIRETKMREEQEFSSWEKNVESVRARIDTVKQNIFEKLD